MSDEEEVESEVDLEQNKGNVSGENEESIVEDDDQEEIIDQNDDDEDVDDDNENEEKVQNGIPSENPNRQSLSKPKEIIKREPNKQKVNPNPRNTLAVKNSQKQQQTKMKSNLLTETNQGTKSIFTKITESIFHSYLNTEEGHKPKAYDSLISEDYLAKFKDQNYKINKEKFNNMLDRQYRFMDEVNSKKKQRQERQQEELKSKCTWTPNGMKQDIKVRNPEDFYTDQLRFLELKNSKIQKKKEDMDINEKNAMTVVPFISRNSKKIAETKHPNETDEDFLQRLKSEKLKTVKEKLIQNKKGDKGAQLECQPKKKKIKKTINELNEIAVKLNAYSEKIQKSVNEERMKKIAQETKRDNNLITDSTKKIFLDKLVNAYEKALLELFNRKDNFAINFAINFESYCSLMSKIGFTLHYNHNPSEETNTNANPNIMKIEEELLKESFSKYLNPNDERIETYYCLLFFLGIIGIYKGKNYQKDQSSQQKKELKEESNIKKTIEEDKQSSAKRKKTPEEFIKCYIPELDLEKYQFSISAINAIKTRYRLFYDNLSYVWTQELNNKRKEKQTKTINVMNSILDKSNNQELKTVAKYSNFKETSRKKIIEKASGEIDPSTNTMKTLKIEEVYDLLKKKKEKELISLRTQKENEDMKECTFQPNAHIKKVSKDISANIEKLYTDGKVTYQKKLQSEDYKKTIENRELEQCTFRPDIHSMNENIKRNPLDADTQLKSKLERREQARIEKEILSFQKKRGMPYMGYSDLRNSNEHNLESIPSMRFDIERKTCKDTFNTYENRNKSNNIFNSTRDIKRAEKQKSIPLLNIEVNIDDNNQIVKLEIFPGDDPIKIAEDFCLKHGLSNDKKEKLQRIIQEKLNEAIGENNSLTQS